MAKKKTKKSQQGDFPKSTAEFTEDAPLAGQKQLVMEFGAAISEPIAGDSVTLEWGAGSDWIVTGKPPC